jgi:AcrR family transcriptional regulator
VTRLAEKRDTHLTRAEIAAETLKQFDSRDGEPSIRSLAAALRVKPAAIYHHFPSRAAVIEAAIELVWQEVNEEGYAMVPDPFTAEPGDVLVAASLATRRVWLRHRRLAPYMAATPDASEFMGNAMAVLASVFERLGHPGDDAAARFHTYASLTLGSTMFAAARLNASDDLDLSKEGNKPGRFRSEPDQGTPSRASEETRTAIDSVVDVSVFDPERDEQMYVEGIRRLIASFGY